jgi:hypothetical protein
VREFLLETFLALIEAAHVVPRWLLRTCNSALLVALHNGKRPSRQLD